MAASHTTSRASAQVTGPDTITSKPLERSLSIEHFHEEDLYAAIKNIADDKELNQPTGIQDFYRIIYQIEEEKKQDPTGKYSYAKLDALIRSAAESKDRGSLIILPKVGRNTHTQELYETIAAIQLHRISLLRKKTMDVITGYKNKIQKDEETKQSEVVLASDQVRPVSPKPTSTSPERKRASSQEQRRLASMEESKKSPVMSEQKGSSADDQQSFSSPRRPKRSPSTGEQNTIAHQQSEALLKRQVEEDFARKHPYLTKAVSYGKTLVLGLLAGAAVGAILYGLAYVWPVLAIAGAAKMIAGAALIGGGSLPTLRAIGSSFYSWCCGGADDSDDEFEISVSESMYSEYSDEESDDECFSLDKPSAIPPSPKLTSAHAGVQQRLEESKRGANTQQQKPLDKVVEKSGQALPQQTVSQPSQHGLLGKGSALGVGKTSAAATKPKTSERHHERPAGFVRF